MPDAWTRSATERLLDRTLCPLCGSRLAPDGTCSVCLADLRGPVGQELWDASQAAAAALEARGAVIARVPRVPVAPRPATAAPAAPAPTVETASAPAAPARESQVSIQSVLAVAGAGLFAIAAIVFAFLNPDLTDHATRQTIVGVVAVLFLAVAWLLRARSVRFSAEAIGALGMVFLALSIALFSDVAPPGVSGWVFAGLGTAVAALLMVGIGALARMRTWVWSGLVGLVLAPNWFGYAAHGVLGATIGTLGSAAVALALHDATRPLGARLASPLRADRLTLVALQALATVVAIGQLPFLDEEPSEARAAVRAVLLVALAVLAALATRTLVAPLWSVLAGGFASAALAVLVFALPGIGDGPWPLALLPVAAALPLVGVAALPRLGSVQRLPALAGGLVVLVATAIPAIVLVLLRLAETGLGFLGQRPGFVPHPDLLHSLTTGLAPGDDAGLIGLDTETTTAAALGVTALTAALAAVALLTRRARTAQPAIAAVAPVLAAWLGVHAIMGWAMNTGLSWAAQALVALIGAAALVLLAGLLARRGAAARHRIPLVAGAHSLVVLGAVLTWFDSGLTIMGGVLGLVAWVGVARVSPAVLRPAHTGIGYAYALLLFGTGLSLAGVEATPVLALTASAGALAALVATLLPRVAARHWYALLVVTLVPFLIGVAQVVVERSGWTALSAGLTMLLAIALLLTRRAGLNGVVRAAAAALIVPSLAVVVISLAAWLLASSGSPVALPIIAVAIAAVLPAAPLILTSVVARGVSESDAGLVRVAIEASSLVTAAIAVLLALVREAAGLSTALLVLVILGIGFIATGALARRRWAWWLAGASFTGALWCVWVDARVAVPEPYFLPTALAAAVVGLVLALLDRGGTALLWSGLACAVVPSVVILAVWGNGDDVAVPWRSAALLAAAVALLAVGAVVSSLAPERRAAVLRLPALVLAIVAAASGAIQAARLGIGADVTTIAPDRLVILPALALSAGAALVAALAARVLVDTSARAEGRLDAAIGGGRWAYLPALVYLAAGVWWAIRRDWTPIWIMWALMLALLLLVVAVAVRQRSRGTTHLPPAWTVYGLAWITGVVAWSPRDLRVETFSIPLGLAALAAGLVLFLRPRDGRWTVNSWPAGFTGSWPLLGPGVFLTILPSVVSTGTDPRTERAIWVIAAALVAILAGAILKLAAPFVLGLVTLPIENVVVIGAQIGRNIQAMPWWITLATAGAVLLAIAVFFERRTSQGKGVAARLRELR